MRRARSCLQWRSISKTRNRTKVRLFRHLYRASVPDDPTRWARPQGRAPQFQARYVAGLEGQASLAEPLRRQAAQLGMDQAERWIALSDAGAGVEDLLRVNFGRVEAVILDFYHAAEHLGDLGRALYPALWRWFNNLTTS